MPAQPENHLSTINMENLPAEWSELLTHVMIGRDAMSVRNAELRALGKLSSAELIKQFGSIEAAERKRAEKLQEAQEFAETLIDAEVRLGTLISHLPRRPGKRTDLRESTADQSSTPAGTADSNTSAHGANLLASSQPLPTKGQALRSLGLSVKLANRLETLARRADLVESAKADARAAGEIVNRAHVLDQIRITTTKERIQAIKDQYADAKPVGIDIRITDKRYAIIYADPPWAYWGEGRYSQARYYPTMTIEDISALPVSRIAADNAMLFLWVTYPILPRAFEVIKAWGFSYSTCGFCWVKHYKRKGTLFLGCGLWSRANTELCLIATKGSMQRISNSVSQIIYAPAQAHSRKPDEAYDRIEQLVGKLPRIELFARQARAGWDHWGNEIIDQQEGSE